VFGETGHALLLGKHMDERGDKRERFVDWFVNIL